MRTKQQNQLTEYKYLKLLRLWKLLLQNQQLTTVQKF